MTQDSNKEQDIQTRKAMIGQLEEIPVGGETSIDDEVIGAIAGLAAREIEGVASLGSRSIQRTIAERVGGADEQAGGVTVEAGRKEAILDINLRVIHGFSIPEMGVKVRQNVACSLFELCGLITKEINIRVTGIEFSDRMPGRVG